MEMFPFGEESSNGVPTGAERNQRLADILLVAGWTGLRWSELRAVRVRDFIEVPMPILVVQRAEPEGVRSRRPSPAGPGGCRCRPGPADGAGLGGGPGAGRAALRHLDRASAARHGVQANPRLGERSPRAGASTTCGTRRPACGWPAASTRSRCRRGWGTPRSPPRTSTCTTSAPRRPGRAGPSQPRRGHTGAQRADTASPNDSDRSRGTATFGLARRGFGVELRGFEPLTFSLRTRRATNCAIAPLTGGRAISRTYHGPAGRISRRLYHLRRRLPDARRCRTRRRSTSRPRRPLGGASAVTGCWTGPPGSAAGPERSMVRTVRGASGLDTYVGTVIGTGSQSAPGALVVRSAASSTTGPGRRDPRP